MKIKYNHSLSILPILFIMFVWKVQAQVISNTFSPEIVIDASSEPYAFDFNADGVIEFYFLVQDLSGDTTIAGLPATYEGSGALLGCQNAMPAGSISSETSAFDVSLFNLGDQLTVFQEYGSDTSYALGIDLTVNTGIIGSLPYQYGAFLGNQGYLGAMFTIGGSLHLGYVELSVLSDGSQITLHSYGYDASEGGNPISVGSSNTNVNEMMLQDVTINVSNNTLQVYLADFDANAELHITDVSGKTRLSSRLLNLQNEFDLSVYETGIYIVSCELNGAIYTQKILLH
tara:strand:+ start:1829 stop:2689 length:861 start_codon:yes stop_codon:yes gene_type:complete